jgi:hypothetical protein
MLTETQLHVIEAPIDAKIFLSGPAGCGKTSAGVERMRVLLNAGVPGESILMLTPQRTLQEPYIDLLSSPERGAGGDATPATLGGIARRMVDLFWPLCAEAAGFARPDQPPVFLTLETAQYYMAHIVRPLLDEGYFESVTIERNRLYSQIIDNLNKAAIVGFPHTDIGSRLDAAYFGEPAQRRIYADAQDCANRFRAHCLQNNLLDFSLQLEVFWTHLWPDPVVRQYLRRSYRHLIYDNVEEDGARAHDLLRAWLPDFDSSLLIFDEGGGYRRFLGADMDTGWALRELCDEHVTLNESFVISAEISRLDAALQAVLLPDEAGSVRPEADSDENWLDATLKIIQTRFYPELLDSVAAETRRLLDEGLSPAEIVIVAPYLSDALRFSLMNRLEAQGIPTRSHRPSRSLHDEPASRTLLTLAALAHPAWKILPPKFDVAYAFMQSIEGLDLVRAQLLTEIVYRPRDFSLGSFENLQGAAQERITYSLGSRYETLRAWLNEYRDSEPLPLDHFLRKLFGEVLSQPGFGFHSNFDSVRVAASLVESVKKFRLNLAEQENAADLGKEYISMLEDGVIAAQYLTGWQENPDSVLVAPATTFLMMNRPVTVQFWLDAGASGWYERLAQPLTHPYVLSRSWDASSGRTWSDADDVAANRDALARLVTGLLRRCRQRIYLGLPELGESGYEQRGDLLKAFNQALMANTGPD